MSQIVGLCGSLRQHSFNRKLLREAARLYGTCNFQELSLDLPLYNGDLETDGRPDVVEALASEIKRADGVIVVSPEYNKAISGVLKNALDWVSRVPGGAWKDKPVAVMTAAGGRAGGETAQYTVRACLTPFGPRLLTSPIVCVANAPDEFDADGRLISERYLQAVQTLMSNLRAEIERS